MTEEYLRLKEECKQTRARMDSYTSQAAALRVKAERSVAHAAELDQRAAKEQLWLEKLQAQMCDAVRDHHMGASGKQTRNRCPGPCGKLRYEGEADAKKARTVAGGTLKPYRSDRCGCWHLTRGL